MKKIVLSLVLAGACALTASAQDKAFPGMRWSQDQARDAVRNGENMSLGDIYARLRNRYGGNPVRSNLVNGSYYDMRWETRDGRILYLKVDAKTGNVLSERG